MLTRCQFRLLRLLETHQGPVGPSYEEIAAALGLKSKSGAHRLMHGLIDRGYVDVPGGSKGRNFRVIRQSKADAGPDADASASASAIMDRAGRDGRLTPAHLALLRLLDANKGDVASSYQEMAQALGHRSKSVIHRMVHKLAECGYVRLGQPRKSRAVEVRRGPAEPVLPGQKPATRLPTVGGAGLLAA